jgi:hypothetical protein
MFVVHENWAHGKQDLTSCREHAWPRKRPLRFLCRALLETHGKDFSPCVVKEGARQCNFTVRYATVCLLPCASTKNARQRLCRPFFSLCRALGKPKFSRSACNACLLTIIFNIYRFVFDTHILFSSIPISAFLVFKIFLNFETADVNILLSQFSVTIQKLFKHNQTPQ